MFTDILAAQTRLLGRLHKTPVLTSRIFNERLGCQLFIKAESLQKTGSFKARGALNFFDTQEIGDAGVTCYSSGNHGQAVSWAAQASGTPVRVFVPEDANSAKLAAIEGYGARTEIAGRTVAERELACRAFAAQSGTCVVPPYDHHAIIAGQGTVMLEVVEDVPEFDAVLVPVGGGGLLAGCALVAKSLRPRCEVFGCETIGADDLHLGLRRGERVEVRPSQTIADGMRHAGVGALNWTVIAAHVAAGLTCSDADVIRAMGDYAAFLKQIVEPSGAVSLACLAAHQERFSGRKVVVIASGGNIDLPTFGRLVSS